MFEKYHAVFRSRWKALWWAAGVCLTAYCVVPSPEQTEAEQARAAQKHSNPWAMETPAAR